MIKVAKIFLNLYEIFGSHFENTYINNLGQLLRNLVPVKVD